MADIKKLQQEAVGKIDSAKATVDKVLGILELVEISRTIPIVYAKNPIAFLLKILERFDVSYEELRLWISNFLIYVLPALEISTKAVLLTNLKKMVSCSIDPRIPEKYRKQHNTPDNFNTRQEYGIDINVESIDYLNKLAISPLSKEGSELYFGLEGVTDVYKFARADDFDAFLWFVIHKGHFPNSAQIRNISNFTDSIHGGGAISVTPSDGTLLEKLEVEYDSENASKILPGNTFTYTGSSHVISMCIDSLYDKKGNNIIKNTLLPISDDWNSVNWYARRADELGKNLGFGWSVNQNNGNTKYNGKGRNYSKERAICNLQYLDQAQTEDSPVTGLINNKIRFTILPKPLVHIPDIANGEPPWRFKKMLFDAKGNYDPNGKYTIVAQDSDSDTYAGGAVNIDKKSGRVTTKPADLIPQLVECYPGLTVYEFNYDYVMSLKLFDPKTILGTLFTALSNVRLSVNAKVDIKHQEATEELRQIIKNIVESDDSTVGECFYTFDNSKYEALLRKSEEKRARQQRFGNITEESGTFDEALKILDEYNANAELHEQVDVLNRAITQISTTISEGVEEQNKYKVRLDFVTDIIEQLTFALVSSLLSPKVLMLLEVNETIMGGKWEKITMRDILQAMDSIIQSVVKEIRDLIVQELYKLVLKYLNPIVEIVHSAIIREQVEDYADAISEILKYASLISSLFSGLFGNSDVDVETTLDTVDYADIDTRVPSDNERPKLDNC